MLKAEGQGWLSWRGAGMLIAGLTATRLLYLILVCPYELAADEAQYWDWSRRLDLSYYSKGPGIAWLIAASTRLFGDSEWAIRLPAAVSIAAAMWATARLASRIGGGRAACLAAAAFACVPAYHATALLMTIDAPYIACWALAALSAWTIRERASQGRPTLPAWLALAAAIGVGFLFKYTILLLIPGLIAWMIGRRPKATAWGAARLVIALALCCVIISPVVIWNQREGWPTLAHLLGHVGAPGGDRVGAAAKWSFDPMWPLAFVGSQIGLIGPMLVLMILAARSALRDRLADPARYEATRFALWTAAPILLFYLAVSFFADVEGNWPIAGYCTLLVPVALEAERFRRAAASPRLRQSLWRLGVGFGVVSGLGFMTINWLDRVPVLTEVIPYHRLSGRREWAREIGEHLRRIRERTDSDPFVISHQYTRAALMAYYLPGRPSVRSATSFMGGRRSGYDFFADTSLTDPSLLGRPALLIGADPRRWSEAFRFEAIEPLMPEAPRRPAVYLGVGFGGPLSR